MKENDGLEAVLAALDKLQNDLCSTEPGHLVEAYEAFETIRNYITGGNGMTTSRPVDAALKSPPEIEGEYTLEGNSAAFVYVCQDGKKIATVYGSGEEKLERGYTIINALNAALKSPPECEIEETQEQKRLKWNLKVIPECLDAIERKEGRAREISQIQFCVIHGDNIREICNAALPHCPDGFVCVPREPTEAMLDAIADQPYGANAAYEKLIAAAEGNK